MGEKFLTIKAEFPGADDAKRADVRAFFGECRKAYKYWQGRRDSAGDVFWPAFKAKFPRAAGFLRWRIEVRAPGWGGNGYRFARGPVAHTLENLDCDNGMVGLLSFADSCSTSRFAWVGPDRETLSYRSEVSSWAEEEPISEYLAAELGAAAAVCAEAL